MNVNYRSLLALAFISVVLIVVTGNYLFAWPADIFFLAAGITYRRQRRAAGR